MKKRSLAQLHQFIVEHYDLGELQELCFDLGIEYENLSGKETRDAKARGLLLQMGERRRLGELLAALRRARSTVFDQADWGEESGTLEALHADLDAFEASTRPLAEKVLRRLGLEQRAGLALLGVLVIVVGVGGVWFLYRSLRPQSPSRMSGDFRIAVAGFAEAGESGQPEIGRELAEGVYLRLEETFAEIDLGFTIGIWGPERVGTIKGNDAAERAESAAKLAQRIGADVVVYGWVDASGPVWQVVPEFYVVADNFYEAQEITGQHDIGSPLSVMGQGTIATRIEVSEAFTARAQALAQITVGLAFYSVHNYEQASAFFRAAEAIEGWREEEGKQVLYLLIGNAAAKSDDFELAGVYHQRSLEIDPEYARGHVGMASVYYMQALAPFDESGDPVDTDLELIDRAIETYQRAMTAAHQPPLADVSTKVHFGLGQCYFARAYAHYYMGTDESFDAAVAEFEAVIRDYGDGENPRIRIQTAESHARLGLICELSGYLERAVKEYQMAAALRYDDPERQEWFEQRAQVIEGQQKTQDAPK